MKRFFGGAFGLLALASCSNDELTSVNRDGDEIAFNVVTNSPTRANRDDVYCNNNKPKDFRVWATFDGKTYINGDDIHSNDNGNTWINNSGTRYWPDGEVTFYAHWNAGDAFQWNDGSPTIKDYTVEDALTQNDLIYAVKKQTKGGEDGKATLNFRHALSQVVFRAKNTNKNLYVEISGVSVCKLGKINTFTYPSQNTGTNIINHNGMTGSITYNETWGKWNSLTGGTTTYSVDFDAVGVPGDSEVKDLTSKNDNDKEYSSKAMLVLPQTTTAWDVTVEDAKRPDASDQHGTYFLVKCLIYNVAGNEVNKNTDVCLWGGNEGNNKIAKDVAIPVSLNWEQGKKYIYTFVFGDGNGGYDPEGPTPVLVPITFNVTVDDFVPVNNEDIKMDKPEESQPAPAA